MLLCDSALSPCTTSTMGNSKLKAARQSREDRALARKGTPTTSDKPTTRPRTRKNAKKDTTPPDDDSDAAQLLMSFRNPTDEDREKDRRTDDFVRREIKRFADSAALKASKNRMFFTLYFCILL